jgi:hypothetical protein
MSSQVERLMISPQAGSRIRPSAQCETFHTEASHLPFGDVKSRELDRRQVRSPQETSDWGRQPAFALTPVRRALGIGNPIEQTEGSCNEPRQTASYGAKTASGHGS